MVMHVFTAERIKADPKKIHVIKAMNPPQSASEVKSLLGMAQYVSRFIPGYAKITNSSTTKPHQATCRVEGD